MYFLTAKVEQSKPVICDCIVVAVGIEPNTSVAEASGFEVCSLLLFFLHTVHYALSIHQRRVSWRI